MQAKTQLLQIISVSVRGQGVIHFHLQEPSLLDSHLKSILGHYMVASQKNLGKATQLKEKKGELVLPGCQEILLSLTCGPLERSSGQSGPMRAVLLHHIAFTFLFQLSNQGQWFPWTRFPDSSHLNFLHTCGYELHVSLPHTYI